MQYHCGVKFNQQKIIVKTKGAINMANKQQELLEVIRESNNSEEAILTAIDIILSFLELHESFR